MWIERHDLGGRHRLAEVARLEAESREQRGRTAASTSAKRSADRSRPSRSEAEVALHEGADVEALRRIARAGDRGCRLVSTSSPGGAAGGAGDCQETRDAPSIHSTSPRALPMPG